MRKSLVTLVGLTHADSVMPVVKSSEVLSATVTQLLVPLNIRAEPNLPDGVQLVFARVP